METYQGRQRAKMNPEAIIERIEPAINNIHHKWSNIHLIIPPGFHNVVLIVGARIKAAKVSLNGFLILVNKIICVCSTYDISYVENLSSNFSNRG